ncbi:nucleoside diphosphate-linked moiety X motif 19-like [Scaptodrosophila lebanonensis]|uniref:Nucleoside diphosphate-linked moiety X motif 19-like n=1 Tax=Drosophila lebanonensis TaxID=7225 RepID=A0A6J2TJ92_DROLE|nr:nucleoside diphosphate-linked moiety X motif 19-like [Scaptodrosophila lebanonensis]
MIPNKEYRPSASLILAAKHAHNPAVEYDYKLLLVKRTEHTSYALNHCVFPGGAFDENADEALEWLTYLHECGVTNEQLQLLNSRQTKDRPYLLTAGQNFSRDISLRLTALREAFEEVGLLFCRSPDSLQGLSINQSVHVVEQTFKREYWQHRVHDDAQQFLQLCRHLNVIPDLWSLSEWSVWRTTATSRRKFDTVYYFSAMESTDVPLLLEPNEVASAHWLHPKDCSQSSKLGIIWLPFMLLYDIARLMHFHSWLELLKFSRERALKGTTLLQPVYYRCDDCMIGVLPGDELYVTEPARCRETIILPGTIDNVNARVKQYNRYIVYDFHNVVLASNVEPLDGHMPIQETVNAKLSKL